MKNRYLSAHFPQQLPRVIQFVATLGILAGSTAHGVDYYKADNTNNLNTVSVLVEGVPVPTWENQAGVALGTAPGNPTSTSDALFWDSRVTSEKTFTLGNNIGVRSVRILNPGGPVTLTSPSHTLTVNNTGGIDMSLATQNLTLGSSTMFYRVAASGANITHNVAADRTLTINCPMTVRENGSNVTVSHPGAGRTIYNNNLRPTHFTIGAGEVQFNSLNGSDRIGSSTTTVNGGKLVLGNTSGSATGSGTVTVNNTGILASQGELSGIMSGAVTVNSGGTLIPRENEIGMLRAGSLNLAAGSTIKWEGVDPSNSDIIHVTNDGGLSLNGGSLQLFNVGTTEPFTGLGTYNIFTYSGSLGGSGLGGLSVAESSRIAGQLYQFGSDGFNVFLTISIDTRPKAFWNVDAGGHWSTAANWTGGVSPNEPTFIANLGGELGVPITAPRTINLNVSSTVGTLIFDSAQPFTISGAQTLSFDDGLAAATLRVKNGSHVISTAIDLPASGMVNPIESGASTLTLSGEINGSGGIAKSGPGTLLLTGDNYYFGDTSNGPGGLLQLGDGGATGSVAGTISNGGTLRINRSSSLELLAPINGIGNVEFAGPGKTSLLVENTYSGATTITGGSIEVHSSLALRNSTLTYSNGAGALTIGDLTSALTLGGLTGDGPFPLANIIDTPVDLSIGQNNSSTTYAGSSIGTGGLFTKAGSGTFTLTGSMAFGGGTTIGGGVLSLEAGSTFTTTTVNTTVGGSKLLVNGGTLNVTGGAEPPLAASLITNASAGIQITSGVANFEGGIVSENNPSNDDFFVNVTGGILNTASLSMPRGNFTFGTTEPTAGSTTRGLYINGGAVNISGNLGIGKNPSNSSVNARMDSGSLTVNGVTTVTIFSPDRWSVLDIAGGSFTSTNIATGINLGGTTAGRVVMLVRELSETNPTTAMVERVQFGQADLGGRSVLNLTGGDLYVGGGGLVLGSADPTFFARLRLGGGVLGATADSSSDVPVSLTGSAVVTGADSLNVPHTVSFSGRVDGTGSLTKNGSGSVNFISSTNSFSGAVTVNSGTLGLSGQSGAITVTPTGALAPTGMVSAQAASSVEGSLVIRYDAGAQAPPGRIHSQGVLTLGPGSVLDISGTGTLTEPFYILASGTAGVSGTFGSVLGTLPDGYTLSYSHNNGSGFPVVALVGSPTVYDIWAASFGLSGDSAAYTADPDGDGVQNLVEYAMGSSPIIGVGDAPVLGRSGDFMTLTFDHIAGGNLTFFIEANDDLADAWETVHTFPPFGAAGTAVYTDNVAVGSNPRRFIRLSVAISN